MAGDDPPPQQSCSAAGCTWTTPAGLPSWDLVIQLITTHTAAAHPGGGGGSATGPHAAKLEKLPRPTFTLNMSESQWDFTEMQWEAYIRQGKVDESQKLHQLQAACNPELLQRIYDAGDYKELNTAKLFMTKLKKLAVLVVHKSIHALNMWKMKQQPEEQIRAFAARITGIADLCGMNVTCSCANNVSYRDPVVLQVLLHGMKDEDIRVRVLTRTTAGELTELHKVVDYIAAEEASIADGHSLFSDVHGSVAGVRKQSQYKQQESAAKPPPTTTVQSKCRTAGGKDMVKEPLRTGKLTAGLMGRSATTVRRCTICPPSATRPRCLEIQRIKTLDLPLPPTLQDSSLL